MKARFCLFVLGALFVGAVAVAQSQTPFKIYFNGTTALDCYVANVTNLSVQGDGSVLATTNLTPQVVNPAACGVITTVQGNVSISTPLAPNPYAFLTNNGGALPAGALTFAVANSSGACTASSSPAAGTLSVTGNNSVSGGTFPAAGNANVNYTVTVSCPGTGGPALSSATVTVPGSGSPGSSCTTGQTGDLSGFTAVCTGSLINHAGACNPASSGSCPTVSGAFTFDNVFGAAYPGAGFGSDKIFSLNLHQFLSIPFTPSPAHSVSFFVNTTYMPDNNAMFSISTAPGLFNGGQANGTTVICAQGRNPNLTTSSNGGSGVGCTLNPNTKYWLNMVPGVAVGGTFQACTTAPCKVAVEEQFQN
jgi:hypothetical protein